MYCRSNPPTAMISSLRPEVRQRFTCAHELGHHILGDGENIDPVEAANSSRNRDEVEKSADLFAGFMLMPSSLIRSLFRDLNSDIETASPYEFLAVASALGVGYTTLLAQLVYSLKFLSRSRHTELMALSPQGIRRELGIDDATKPVLILDKCWRGRPLDLPLNGYLFVRHCATESLPLDALRQVGSVRDGQIFKAKTVGTFPARVNNSDSEIRIYPARFAGLARHRFTPQDSE